MLNYTENLGLIKPTAEENFDIEHFNKNSDILDKEIADRLKKNAPVEAGTKTKVTYDENGLVLGGENLLPEDIPNLHVSKIEGRPPIVYINDIPIYGSRFVDVDDTGGVILRADGSGEYLLTVLETGEILLRKVVTQIADNLESDSAKEALSAKQGKILSGWIGKVSELLTTAKTNIVEAVNELFEALTAHKTDKNNPHAVSKSQIGLTNVLDVEQAAKTDFEAHTSNISNPHKVTKAQLGLENVNNTADSSKNVLSATKLTTARKINGVEFDGTNDITITDDTKIPLTQKGTAGGVAELNESGFVPASQLPSYVDDTIEGTLATFPATGESGKIYVDTDTNLTYRWSGTQYVEISKSLALGETSSTAYPGSKGKQTAEEVAALKETALNHEERISENETDIVALEKNKADLENGIVPDGQLPYYNKTQNIYIDGVLIYPVSFLDVDESGELYLRADGTGDYLLHIPLDGVPRARYMGNAVTDDVTGIAYSFAVSDGVAVVKQVS